MEIFIIVILILTGVFASFLSAILITLSQDRLNEIIEEDYKAAQLLQDLKSKFEDNISPFQIIEVINYSAAGVVAGIYISSFYTELMYFILGIFIYALTILIIRYIFQALGMRWADQMALLLSPLLSMVSAITNPIFILIKFLSDKIAGETNEDDSRDEINQLVESAREEGSLDADEYRILKNIMHFSNVFVADVMTPRTVVFSSDAYKSVGEIVKYQEIHMHSRIPIWEGESIDDGVIGYVMVRDILRSALSGKTEIKLIDLAREIFFIEEDEVLDEALERFLHRRQHMFMVIDEYGGIAGLITMEDVLETMLGVEIVDEADKFEDMRLLAKQKRDKRIASLELDKKDLF